MEAGKDIAIVGAGIGGLTAAIALRRTGQRVTLFERFLAPGPIGSGLMLQPAGLAALERLGLREQMTALGARIARLHGVTDRGRTVFDLAYADLDPTLYALAVHRAALHGVLWGGFATSGAALEVGRTIVGIDSQSGGRACVIDATGRRAEKFDLVVDASGVRSTLRALVSGGKMRPFTYGAVWATVADIGLAPHMLAQRYIAARVMVGYLPAGRMVVDGPDLAALFWSLKPASHATWADGFDDWRTEVGRLWPELAPVVSGLSGPEDFTLAEYQHFTARQPVRGAIALIGDSAHATSPQLGQGANNAMLDALALADALERYANIGDALTAYARARRRHVRFFQVASAVMTPFFQSDSRLAPWLRDATFHRMRLVPYLRREMIRTLAGLKTGIFTHRDAGALAGSAVEKAAVE